MSEKRFSIDFASLGVFDNQTKKIYKINPIFQEEDLINFMNNLAKENEHLQQQLENTKNLYNKCREHKLSDEAIKQAYADLNRREREKHSHGDTTFSLTMKHNEVIY